MTTPSTSPADKTPVPRLSRLAPDILRCTTCSIDLAYADQIISKGFTGRYGRALLVAPPPDSTDGLLTNIRIGRSEDRQLVTGWHVVADISCGNCRKRLGWKYVDAQEKSQRYKVGKYILETERVTAYRSWGDSHLGDPTEKRMLDGDEGLSRNSDDEITFDSEDEDECDDIFAGVWDADEVAKRRNNMVGRRHSTTQN